MTHHVIIGGGPAATNAMETIRQFDEQATITLISDEPAHSRMALPYWLAGNIPREHCHTADDAHFAKRGVTAKIGSRVTKIDVAGKSVELDDGSPVEYDNLLWQLDLLPSSHRFPALICHTATHSGHFANHGSRAETDRVHGQATSRPSWRWLYRLHRLERDVQTRLGSDGSRA